MNENTFEFLAAGVKHHRISEVLGRMEDGDALRMVPEPTNKFDPNAIRLHYLVDDEEETKEVMVGYVPAKLSPAVSAFLVTSDNPTAEIILVDRAARPWEMLRVRVYDRGEEQDA